MKHSTGRQAASLEGWGAAWRQAVTASGTASALSIGWDLALPIFGGVLLGHHLDRSSGTRFTYTIGLLLLGLLVGVYNVARTLQREIRRHQLDSIESPDSRFRNRTQEVDEGHGDHL
jgi:F0F1-type ATP synthase assembly protein I